jgi:hypothetical protein
VESPNKNKGYEGIGLYTIDLVRKKFKDCRDQVTDCRECPIIKECGQFADDLFKFNEAIRDKKHA